MSEGKTIAELARMMVGGIKDMPTMMECAPGVMESLSKMAEKTVGQENLGELTGLFGIPVVVKEGMSPGEWKIFSGEKLLIHCFPNPVKEGELIVFRPVQFISPEDIKF